MSFSELEAITVKLNGIVTDIITKLHFLTTQCSFICNKIYEHVHLGLACSDMGS